MKRNGLLKRADAAPKSDLHLFGFGDQLKLAEVVLGVERSPSIEAVRKLLSVHHSDAASFRTRLALGLVRHGSRRGYDYCNS